jgi:hypothetical protein
MRKNMSVNKIVILSVLLILVNISPIWADENESTGTPFDQNQSIQTEPPAHQSFNDHQAGVSPNTLKSAELKKNSIPIIESFNESLNQIKISLEIFQDFWKYQYAYLPSFVKSKSSNIEFGKFILKTLPNDRNYSEEKKTQDILKLLQTKHENNFKEIFLGLRFSLETSSGQIDLEMSVTPSFDNHQGLAISF